MWRPWSQLLRLAGGVAQVSFKLYPMQPDQLHVIEHSELRCAMTRIAQEDDSRGRERREWVGRCEVKMAAPFNHVEKASEPMS